MDVAHQKIVAAGVAMLADLSQDAGDRNLFGKTPSHPVAVVVDETPPVSRRAQQRVLLWRCNAN